MASVHLPVCIAMLLDHDLVSAHGYRPVENVATEGKACRSAEVIYSALIWGISVIYWEFPSHVCLDTSTTL